MEVAAEAAKIGAGNGTGRIGHASPEAALEAIREPVAMLSRCAGFSRARTSTSSRRPSSSESRSTRDVCRRASSESVSPSLSSSGSQASPLLSRSASAWSALAVVGQLSAALPAPSRSESTNSGAGSEASGMPSLSSSASCVSSPKPSPSKSVSTVARTLTSTVVFPPLELGVLPTAGSPLKRQATFPVAPPSA
jgi:hypothetical protein